MKKFLIIPLFLFTYLLVKGQEVNEEKILQILNDNIRKIETFQAEIKFGDEIRIVKYLRPDNWRVEDNYGNLVFLKVGSESFLFNRREKIVKYLDDTTPYYPLIFLYIPLYLSFYLEPEIFWRNKKVYYYQGGGSYFLLIVPSEGYPSSQYLLIKLDKRSLKIEKILTYFLEQKIISETKINDFYFPTKIISSRRDILEEIELKNIKINSHFDKKMFIFTLPDDFLIEGFPKIHKEGLDKKEDPIFLFNVSISYLKENEYQKAIYNLEKLKEIKPKAPALYIYLSYAYWKEKKLEDMVENLEKYISLNPLWFEAECWKIFDKLDCACKGQFSVLPSEKIELAEYMIKNMKNKVFAYNFAGYIFSQGDLYEKAIMSYENLMKIDKKRKDFYIQRLIEIYEKQKEIEKALTKIDELIKINPNNHEFYFSKANLLGKVLKFEESEKFLKKGFEKVGDIGKKMQFLSSYIYVLYKQKNYEAVKNYCQKYLDMVKNLEIPSFHIYSYFFEIYSRDEIKELIEEKEEKIKNSKGGFSDYVFLFLSNLKENNFEKAKNTFLDFLEKYPEGIFLIKDPNFAAIFNRLDILPSEEFYEFHLEVFLKTMEIFSGYKIYSSNTIGHYLSRLKDEKKIKEIIEKIPQEDKNFIEGIVFFEKERYEDAIEKFKKMLNFCKDKKEEKEVRYYLAYAYKKLNKIKDSIAEYEKLLEDESFYKVQPKEIIELYKKEGILDEIEKKLERELSEKYLSKYKLLAQIYLEKGKIDELEKLCEKGIEIFLNEEFFYLKLSSIYFLKSNYKRILEIIDKQLKKSSGCYFWCFPEDLLFDIKCYILRKEKDFENLKKFLTQSVFFQKKYIHLLAEAYIGQGKIEDAKRVYEKILKVDENDRKAMLELANIYLKKGEVDRAEDLYNKIIDYNKGKDKSKKENQNFCVFVYETYLEKLFPNIYANYLPYLGLAECYICKKEYKKSLEIIENLLNTFANREVREKCILLLQKLPEDIKFNFISQYKYPLDIPSYSIPGRLKFVHSGISEISVPYKGFLSINDRVKVYSENKNLLFEGIVFLLTPEIVRIKIENDTKNSIKENEKVFIMLKSNEVITDIFKDGKLNENLWEIYATNKPFMKLEKNNEKILIEGISSKAWGDIGIKSKFQSENKSFIASMDFKVLWGDPLIYLNVNKLTLAYGANLPYQIIIYNPFLNTGPIIERFGDEDRTFHNLTIKYDNKTKNAICYVDGIEIGKYLIDKENTPFTFSVEPNTENVLIGIEITNIRVEFLD